MPRALLPPGCPEPDLQSLPSRSGACCSPGPSGSCRPRKAQLPPSPFLFVLHLPGDLREGLYSSEREQALPPPPSFLGVLRSRAEREGEKCVLPRCLTSSRSALEEEALRSPHLRTRPRSPRVRQGAPPGPPGFPPLRE